MIVKKIQFPIFTGIKCNMMPFVQGDSRSLSSQFQPYAEIINSNFLEKGKIGFLTIDESFVEAGKSQRGFGVADRKVHIEVGRTKELDNHWGWGGASSTLLADSTKVLVANSISDTCRVWDTEEKSYTKNGDLSNYIEKYPEHTGILLKAGEVAKISIFTPHECVAQKRSGNRQFFRIVGNGVKGRENYFTVNPLVELQQAA